MTNLREESVRKLPDFDGLLDENADSPGLSEGLPARLRLFLMVRTGRRLAEIRRDGKGRHLVDWAAKFFGRASVLVQFEI